MQIACFRTPGGNMWMFSATAPPSFVRLPVETPGSSDVRWSTSPAAVRPKYLGDPDSTPDTAGSQRSGMWEGEAFGSLDGTMVERLVPRLMEHSGFGVNGESRGAHEFLHPLTMIGCVPIQLHGTP